MTARYEAALDVADSAEQMVRAAEDALAAATDPTQRDVLESRLNECLQLQDEALEAVAPAIEQRQRQIAEAAREAVRSLRGEVTADWTAKHRRWHAPAVKALLVRRLGRRTYEKAFPR